MPLIPAAVWWLTGGGIAAAGAGYLAKGTSETVKETGNTVVKVAIAGGILFLIAKQFKVI